VADLGVDAQARYAHVRHLLARYTPAPAEVVELGAAPGDQIAALAGLGYRATAVDIGLASDEWGGGEPGRMARLLEAAGVRYVEWDLEEVPYPLESAAFDAVLLTEVFEHLRDYPVRALEESRRVLRPGGFLYFTTPNAAYLKARVTLLLGRSPASPLADWVAGVPHARHAREYTFAEVRWLMDHVGLEVVHCGSRHFHLHGGSAPVRLAKRAIDLTARLRPTWGPEIVIVARKRP
jgi:SAM-dependent methyltransferase